MQNTNIVIQTWHLFGYPSNFTLVVQPGSLRIYRNESTKAKSYHSQLALGNNPTHHEIEYNNAVTTAEHIPTYFETQ